MDTESESELDDYNESSDAATVSDLPSEDDESNQSAR